MTLQRGCHNPCMCFFLCVCVCYIFSPNWCYALWTLLWCYAIHVILSVSPSTYTCFRWYKVFSCNLTSKNLYQQQGRFKLQLVMMEADLYNVISVCWFCGTLGTLGKRINKTMACTSMFLYYWRPGAFHRCRQIIARISTFGVAGWLLESRIPQHGQT